MTGSTVIHRPHGSKKNQRVMNRQQSISISGKHHPENTRGEGTSMRAAAWRRDAPSILKLTLWAFDKGAIFLNGLGRERGEFRRHIVAQLLAGVGPADLDPALA